MKKLMLGSLLALTATGAMAKNPYAHLDEWYDTCNHGGAYIDFSLERHEYNQQEVVVPKASGTAYVEEVYDVTYYITKAETKYVPTDGDVREGRKSKESQKEKSRECHDALKDVAYSIEATVDDSYSKQHWKNIKKRQFHSLKTDMKNIIDDIQGDIKWSSSPHQLHSHNNGTFKDDAKVFEGRQINNLPEWIRVK